MSMPAGRLSRLCQKELRETLRDRRTMITLVLMPLLVYPLLSMTLNRFLLNSGVEGQAAAFRLGVASDPEGEWLVEQLQDKGSLPPEAIVQASGEDIAQFEVVAPADGVDLSTALREGTIDVAVKINFAERTEIIITALAENAASVNARRILVQRLNYLNNAKILARLLRAGIPPPRPVEVRLEEVGERDSSQPLLATIIPLVLVLMTITGAVYPAIDLTAGERERGTMEALIASPISRGTVLVAKYVAVVTVALLTAVANLAAMFVTLWAAKLLPLLVGPEAGFPWLAFLQILCLLVLFSAFFSAVLLALTSFARSFKEAQAYLIPLMLLSLAPGVLSLFPGVRLTPTLALAPLLNIILLSREILAGTTQLLPATLSVLATVIYAMAALGLASRLFGSDAVLRGSEASFAAALQRPEQARAKPSLNEVAMTFALIFPCYFLVSNLIQQESLLEWLGAAQSQGVRFGLNALSLALVFGGLPLFAAWFSRDRLPTTFRLRRPRVLSVIGAMLIGLGIWTWSFELYQVAKLLGIQELAAGMEGAKELAAKLQQMPPWIVLATLVVAPGLIEELCFRGYLFSSLEARFKPGLTILASALLFGLFHVLTGNALLLERFLPTTLTGIVLGLVAWRTGSVWPGIALHVVHNSLLELVGIYQSRLMEWGIGSEEQTHLPWTWLAAGTTLTVIGGALIAVQRVDK